ncbi:TPA: hypothetical protein N0F65_003162 [Lagenidium giganteum]|uniref:Acyltransferase n=1 Tax=Lagenidium giganteum TaxID=4803 RepID=A0AAV2ZBX4_9STRA|nr:TPA: hypothetical protein N0F65_003162 [Lagenidium giganteum]
MVFMYSIWLGSAVGTASGLLYVGYRMLLAGYLMLKGQNGLQVLLGDSLLRVAVPVLALYVLYQLFFWKTRVNPGFRQYFMDFVRAYPYFATTGLVFDNKQPDERVQIEPNDKNMFAFHPHGVTSLGWSYNGVYNHSLMHSDLRWLVTSAIFFIPVLRNMMAWIGAEPIEKNHVKRLLSESRNVCLIPGGYEKATIYERNKHRVYMRHRAGFIKLALQHGYKVHPVYTFGEEQSFYAFPYLLSWRLLLNRVKLPGCMIVGVWWCFFLPFPNINLITVVGDPIQLPKIDKPSRADVSKYHSIYIKALEDLFERNKAKYATAGANAKLEIF